MAPRKTVLITGCSAGGIGSALAFAFHARGLKVYATARNLSKVSHLKDAGIATVELDIASPASIAAAVGAVKAETDGTLDVLVNNAGIGYQMPFLDASIDEARKLFDANVFGRMAVTQAFAPLLIAAKGTIVNIGSISAIAPSPWASIYNAACAAVQTWNDTLRLELMLFGVKVILVLTGMVKTEFYANVPTKALPADSLYLPNKERVEATMFGAAAKETGGTVMSAAKYAELVVNNVLKPNPRKRHWAGTLQKRMWAAHTFLWDTAWDLWMPGLFGITDLSKKLLATRREDSKI